VRVDEFRLFAHGKSFDVDAYMATTTLAIDYVWRLGEQRRFACGESKHNTSGVEIVLGDWRVLPIFQQEETAIDYLGSHGDDLRELAKYPGVDAFILALQYYMELVPNVFGFCLGPPIQLMRLALDVGVEPTYYVTLDRLHELEGSHNAARDFQRKRKQ
jgi:hypothetical protein